MFKTNYSNTSGLIPAGEYECIIRDVVNMTNQNGTIHLNVRLIIRNDVEQSCQNRYIFHKIWKLKATGDYDERNFNDLAKSANLGDEKEYVSLLGFFKELELKPVKVTVYHETFNDRTSEKVKNFDRTAHPEVKHDMSKIKDKSTGVPSQTSKPEINREDDDDDDSLPF